MKIIAQGDPVEYEVEDAADACRLYRKDMTAALIGVVTHVTDYERAQRMAKSIQLFNENYQELYQAYEHVVRTREAATKESMRLEAERDRLRKTIIQMRDSGHELPASLMQESLEWD